MSSINHNLIIEFFKQSDAVDGRTINYRLKMTSGPHTDPNVPSEIFVIQRTTEGSNSVDRYYGLAKPSDFRELNPNTPNPGQLFYLAKEWTLDFSSSETMKDFIKLTKDHLDELGQAMELAGELNDHEIYITEYIVDQ